MRTIFGLFKNYADAKAAVSDLLDRGFSQAELNAIAQDWVVKSNVELSLSTVNVAAAGKPGELAAHGLDAMLGGEQAVRVAEAGNIYASGNLATILANTASIEGEAKAGLKPALVNFGVPDDIAGAFVDGVGRGGVLLFVRTSDERAPEVGTVLRGYKGLYVAGYTPR